LRTSALNYAELSHGLREHVLILVMQSASSGLCSLRPFTKSLEASPTLEVCGGTKMPSDEWIRTFADGRRVKFSDDELMDATFITAQIEGNEVVYSILLNKAETNLSRKEVEGCFQHELSKK